MRVLDIRLGIAFTALSVLTVSILGCSSNPLEPGDEATDALSAMHEGEPGDKFLGEFSIANSDGEPVLLPVREGQVDFNGTEFLSVIDPGAPIFLCIKSKTWFDDPSEPDPMQGTMQYQLELKNNTDLNVYDPWLIFVDLGVKEYLNPDGITSRAFVDSADASFASRPYVSFGNVEGIIPGHSTHDVLCDVFFPREANKKLAPVSFVAYGSWPWDYFDVGEGHPNMDVWRNTYDATGGRGMVGSAIAPVEEGEYYGWVQYFKMGGVFSGSLRLDQDSTLVVYLPPGWETDFVSRDNVGWPTGPIEYAPPLWLPENTPYAYLPVNHPVYGDGWLIKILDGIPEGTFVLCNGDYFDKWQAPGVHSEYIGLPTADADGPYAGLDDVDGYRQEFEGGQVVTYPDEPVGFAETVVIWGPIYDFWDVAGQNESIYGWPKQDAVYHSGTGYYDQEFQNGTITWDPVSGDVWDDLSIEIDFRFPVAFPDADGYYKTQEWMTYMAPYGYHLGDDWDVIGGAYDDYGDPFYATEAGTVTLAHNFTGTWGWVIGIQHDDVPGVGSVTSMYAHCKQIFVDVDQVVSAGELIGEIGNADGLLQPHLHFEIRLGTDTTMDKSHNPTLVTQGPQGQVNPTEFLNNH